MKDTFLIIKNLTPQSVDRDLLLLGSDIKLPELNSTLTFTNKVCKKPCSHHVVGGFYSLHSCIIVIIVTVTPGGGPILVVIIVQCHQSRIVASLSSLSILARWRPMVSSTGVKKGIPPHSQFLPQTNPCLAPSRLHTVAHSSWKGAFQTNKQTNEINKLKKQTNQSIFGALKFFEQTNKINKQTNNQTNPCLAHSRLRTGAHSSWKGAFFCFHCFFCFFLSPFCFFSSSPSNQSMFGALKTAHGRSFFLERVFFGKSSFRGWRR